ncbi:MAG: hypothetical protein J7L11_09960 [Thermoprotei archaeon]|nr:hypothetical protein [Thermoprotei archaeon]
MGNGEREEYGELLRNIELVIALKSSEMEKLRRKIREAAEEAGFKVYLRAEGYALMRDESVGFLGLPHLRVAFIGNRVIVWVRNPYGLKVNFLRLAGLSPSDYYSEILRVVEKLVKVFKGFQQEAEELFISLPN